MRTFTATQAGVHVCLGIGPSTYRIHDAKHLEPGQVMDQPDGTYILLIVSDALPNELNAPWLGYRIAVRE